MAGPCISHRNQRYGHNKLGLRVHSVHAPFSGLDIGLPDTSLKAHWLEVVGASLDVCAELEAGVAVLHASSHRTDLGTTAAYKASADIIVEFVADLHKRARRLGVALALENLLAHGTQRRVGLTRQELSRNFPHQDIGFCLDIGYSAVGGFDISAEMRASHGRLLSVHADNNDGRQDWHWVPSRGIVNWEQVKTELAANGYRGLYMLEVNGASNPDPVLEETTQFARQDVRGWEQP